MVTYSIWVNINQPDTSTIYIKLGRYLFFSVIFFGGLRKAFYMSSNIVVNIERKKN